MRSRVTDSLCEANVYNEDQPKSVRCSVFEEEREKHGFTNTAVKHGLQQASTETKRPDERTVSIRNNFATIAQCVCLLPDYITCARWRYVIARGDGERGQAVE